MTTTLNIDVFDRSNRLGAVLENAGPSKTRKSRYHFEVKRHRKFQAAKNAGGGFCIVRIGSKEAGLEQLRKLRDQLDRKQWQGVVAVLNKKLAADTQIQRVLLQPGRTNALRFIIEDASGENTNPIVDHLMDLIEITGEKNSESEIKSFHPPYLEATRPIRNSKSMRLDAKLIADYFDLSLRELARILGKIHGTIDKTPDSKNLQPDLRIFEAILRGRLLVNHDDALFRQWLNTGSDALPKQNGSHPSPMDIIRMGHPEVVAGMVDRELTGEPS
ncbi:MAG: hypothetical protein ACLFUF_08145 [Opitutales bacterium]